MPSAATAPAVRYAVVAGVAHTVTAPASLLDAFDDPSSPVGATGLVTVDCGLPPVRARLQRDPDGRPRCPVCG